MSALTLLGIGRAALWIYTKHILVFTIGACLGAIEAFGILYAMWGPGQ
jgi:hypothetical protein